MRLFHKEASRDQLWQAMVKRTKVDFLIGSEFPGLLRCVDRVLIQSIECEDGSGFNFNLRILHWDDGQYETIFFSCKKE